MRKLQAHSSSMAFCGGAADWPGDIQTVVFSHVGPLLAL
jgi:hypothetical protein